MDATQLLFNIVLTITTILLVIIGVQLIFILKELRRGLRQINKIIADFEKIGNTFEDGLSEIIGFVKGITSVFKIIDIFHKKKSGKSEK